MSANRGVNWVIVAIGSAALALTAAACSDSVHLDPPEGSGSGTTTSTGTGGSGGDDTSSTTSGGGDASTTAATTTTSGAGGSDCNSNSDCPSDPNAFESAICDTYYGKCVECLVAADCVFRPGTTCAQGMCVCPKPNESFCDPLGGQAARCVDLQSNPADCGTCGHACFQTCGAGKCTDAWEPTETVNAPSARTRHVAVWTNTNEMVVWGGFDGSYLNTGGVYNPATRVWKTMSIVGAPAPRGRATAVWSTTLNKMIVWGGIDSQGAVATGGIYDPTANSWTALPTSGSLPSARYHHTAIWTGAKMFISGGEDGVTVFGDSFSFDPALMAWAPLSNLVSGVTPVPDRARHTAVWSGVLMLVFGGFDGVTQLQQGLAYNPGINNWSPLASLSTPSARENHTAVWNGTAMMIWGGFDGSYLASGATYNLAQDFWTPMNAAPTGIAGRRGHSAVWMPSTNRMVVWGGENGAYLGDGASFDPVNNDWNVSPMPTDPAPRAWHTAVVTDTNKMLVWGGDTSGGPTATGALFDPALAP